MQLSRHKYANTHYLNNSMSCAHFWCESCKNLHLNAHIPHIYKGDNLWLIDYELFLNLWFMKLLVYQIIAQFISDKAHVCWKFYCLNSAYFAHMHVFCALLTRMLHMHIFNAFQAHIWLHFVRIFHVFKRTREICVCIIINL